MERRSLFRALAGAALAPVAAKAAPVAGASVLREFSIGAIDISGWQTGVSGGTECGVWYAVDEAIDWHAPLPPLAQPLKARIVGGASRIADLAARFDEATDYAATLSRIEDALDAAHDTDCDGRSPGATGFVTRVAPSEAPVASGHISVRAAAALALAVVAPAVLRRFGA